MEIKVFKFDNIEGEIKSLNEFLGEFAPAYEVKEKTFLDEKILCLCKGKTNYYTVNQGDAIIVKEDAQGNKIVIKLDKYDIQKINN